MTETKDKPKRGRGRLIKYKTDEERRLAYNAQVKESMLRNPFHCDFCNQTYHIASRNRHLKTKKHKKSYKKSFKKWRLRNLKN